MNFIIIIILFLVNISTCYCVGHELDPQTKIELFEYFLKEYTEAYGSTRTPGWHITGMNSAQLQEFYDTIAKFQTVSELKAAAKIYYYGMKVGVNL